MAYDEVVGRLTFSVLHKRVTPQVSGLALVVAVMAALCAAALVAFASYTTRAGYNREFRDTNQVCWVTAMCLFAAMEMLYEVRMCDKMHLTYPIYSSPTVEVRIRGVRVINCLVVYFVAMFLMSGTIAVAFAFGNDSVCVCIAFIAAILFALTALLATAQRHRTLNYEAYIEDELFLAPEDTNNSPHWLNSPTAKQPPKRNYESTSSTASTLLNAEASVPRDVDDDDVMYQSRDGSVSSKPATRGLCSGHLVPRCITVVHVFLRFLWLVLGVGVLMGAYIAGQRFTYSGKGQFAHNIGPHKYSVLYRCVGPRTVPNTPVFIIDADASHGSADFWPLQEEMKNRGLRSCIFDKPGVGYSSWYNEKQDLLDLSDFYAEMIASFGEEPPYVMVGWGGGATNVWSYALTQNRTKIAGVVLLDGYRGNIEWRQHKAYQEDVLHKPSIAVDALESYRADQLASRFTLFGLIRGVAVPLGLMPLFVGRNSSQYADATLFTEYRWFYLLPKTWATQYFTLKEIAQNADCKGSLKHAPPHLSENATRLLNEGATATCSLWTAPPASHADIHVLSIISNQSRQDLCNNAQETDINSAKCEKLWFEQQFQATDAINLTKTIAPKHHTVSMCSVNGCGLGMPLSLPIVVVSKIVEAGMDKPFPKTRPRW